MSINHHIEGAVHQGVGDFSLLTHRINSLNERGFGIVVGSLAGFSLTVAVVFSMLGAWLILPFAGLEAMALYWAYRWVGHHAQDSESLVIRGDAVVLAVREAAQTRRYEFNRLWAQLVVQSQARGHTRDLRLALRSHGTEVEVGRYLDDGGRQRLALELKARLRAH